MAVTKKPVTGMKDILPEEMQIRDYVMGVIKENYRKFGFTPIETGRNSNILFRLSDFKYFCCFFYRINP